MSSTARSAATRQRLLEAAVQVFAEKGFRSATIGQICRRAGANIAAAHYHFGDKERLYAAVFDYAVQRAAEDRPAEVSAGGTPAARLRTHVTAFLERLLDPGRPAWIARLIAREMIEPTPVLDRLVRERMRANHEQIATAIGDLLGPEASPETIRLSTLSVVAQCVFYRNSAPVISRLYPDLVPQREIERIADHVTRFSVAGVRGLRRSARGDQA